MMSKEREQFRLTARMSRIGAMFGTHPARRTPDLEQVLIDVVRYCPGNARLFVMTASWLKHYTPMVARHRLCRLIDEQLDAKSNATMGLLLSTVNELRGGDWWASVLKRCQPLVAPEPLFDVMTINPAMRRLAKSEASDLSRVWGVWADNVIAKDDAIRPLQWVLKKNPTYQTRALFKGQLKTSIMATFFHEQSVFDSEIELARRCGVTRKAMREAVDDLILCGLLSREITGRCSTLRLLASLSRRVA